MIDYDGGVSNGCEVKYRYWYISFTAFEIAYFYFNLFVISWKYTAHSVFSKIWSLEDVDSLKIGSNGWFITVYYLTVVLNIVFHETDIQPLSDGSQLNVVLPRGQRFELFIPGLYHI